MLTAKEIASSNWRYRNQFHREMLHTIYFNAGLSSTQGCFWIFKPVHLLLKHMYELSIMNLRQDHLYSGSPNVNATIATNMPTTELEKGGMLFHTSESKGKHPSHSARISPPAAREEGMNAITSLPVIQVDHLPNSPPPNRHDSEHRKSLRLQALHLHQQVCHPSDHETHECVQEPDSKPLSPQLHP